MRTRFPGLAALPLGLALQAGCDGSPTHGATLTPQQVQGVYSVCTLRFVPTQGALPAADLLASVVHTSPPAPKQPPSLTLSGSSESYQLIYTRRSDNFLQQLNGSVDLFAESLRVRFPAAASSEPVREALLPEELWLNFADAPRRLTTQPGAAYSVRRADYARAAGITEEGLQDHISGTLSASFSTSGCA
jgi:hypothetical protein